MYAMLCTRPDLAYPISVMNQHMANPNLKHWIAIMMGGGAISWSSKRQLVIILSTTNAKYMTSTQATKEAIWLIKLMKELGYMKEKKAMVIQCDNQGAISLMKNPTQHARTKHIDVQHHFVRK